MYIYTLVIYINVKLTHGLIKITIKEQNVSQKCTLIKAAFLNLLKGVQLQEIVLDLVFEDLLLTIILTIYI